MILLKLSSHSGPLQLTEIILRVKLEMANKEHLTKIEKGVNVWNKWRCENSEIIPDLSGADLCKKNLEGINLHGVNLREADLNEAEFIKADFREADLSRAKAISTNFKGANLTGALIEDWEINVRTSLDEVTCDYIYFNRNQQERYPSNPTINFAPGEFAKYLQKDLENKSESGSVASLAIYTQQILSQQEQSNPFLPPQTPEESYEGANPEECLALLRQGIERWNKWREENPEIKKIDLRGVNLWKANLSKANLSGVNFSGANLSEANLSEAKFSEGHHLDANFNVADLSKANLWKTNLSKAYLCGVNLCEANLSKANLREAYLGLSYLNQADLSQADLDNAQFNAARLIGADLSGARLWSTNFEVAWLTKANLRGASLSRANLWSAILEKADLQEADLDDAILRDAVFSEANLNNASLIGTQALRTDFQGANLTGALIEDWNINSETRLDEVICDYVYLKADYSEEKTILKERRPLDPNRNFASGEFSKLFQKALETIELIFLHGINWQAFLESFQKLGHACDANKLSISSIENKGDGFFIIQVNVPVDADKVLIQQSFEHEYAQELKRLERTYRRDLKAKNMEIETHKARSTDLMEVIKLLADKPITVEAKAVASGGNTYNQSGQFGIGQMSGGKIEEGATVAGILNEAQQQNLATAALEIQQLLKHIEQKNSTATEAEKIAYVDDETSSGFKRRVVSALQAGGEAAIEEFLDNSYINIGKAIVKGWIKSE
jgi:uncharacterized protein YjbI with pentapeptide repeats